MNPLPSFTQIQDAKHLHATDLFGPASIARMTGTSLRDVFRIIRPAPPADAERFPVIVTTPAGKILGGVHVPARMPRLPDWLKTADDGTVLAGRHRLAAMLRVAAE